MRTRLTAAAALCALLGAAPQLAAQQVASGALTDADITAIKEVAQQWAAHAEMGHAAVVAKLYTEDAIELPPYMSAMEGRAAIEERIAEAIANLSDITITSVEIVGMGDMAFDRGTYSVTVEEEGMEGMEGMEGKKGMEGMEGPMTVTGKYISVLRKQADGAWLISRLIWNENTMPAGMPEM